MSNHEEKNNSDSKSSAAADHKSGGVDYKSLEDDINALYLVKGTGDGGHGGHGADGSEGETLSRHNPLTEFLKQNKGILKDLSQEEFKAKYSEYMKGLEDKNCNASAPAKVELKRADTIDTKPTESSTHERDYLEQIVLKFTTLSEANLEAPSFTVKKNGAKIGREPVNEVCVPSDTRLASVGHSFIEYEEGSFYLVDGGYSFSASIRIGAVGSKKIWTMPETARFSVGNSVFESGGVNSEGNLLLKILEGPLKGEVRVITKKGATLGRSSDNVIAIQDRELSRKHSRVEFNESLQEYCVSDIGSTNGTYIQLVGPYGGRYKLCINDHILVGRTGFSINRYDYGISEEIGSRQTMEDSCIILQNMDLQRVHYQHVSPQSFFGVFDGHGGSKASLYLSQHLHINVGEALNSHGAEIRELLSQIDEDAENPLDDNADVTQELDQIIISSLERSFLKTDHDFVTKSEYAQNGSTATTALIMGNRLYCANVGDSRSLLCRNFKAIPMTEDHKPTREDEQKRIRDAGGFVINNRVMGELAVSRAFGDAEFKKGIQSIIDEEGVKLSSNGKDNDDKDSKNWDQPLIIAKPDVEATTLTSKDQFLLLACDGLFDVFTAQEVVDFVRTNMSDHGDAQKCCENLTDEAINTRNSRDNVSVILIILNKWY